MDFYGGDVLNDFDVFVWIMPMGCQELCAPQLLHYPPNFHLVLLNWFPSFCYMPVRMLHWLIFLFYFSKEDVFLLEKKCLPQHKTETFALS